MEGTELARQVLGLSGPRAQVESVLRTLLGTDARFREDGFGRWSLVPDAALGGRRLGDLRYAVVDVETTGSSPRSGHRVTEVALVEVRGSGRVDSFSTLVNPGRPIPRRIQAFTGITDRMVEQAPHFHEVAPELLRRLEGRVFVAHNAPFDWRFVSAELARAGKEAPEGPRLCTVRLARRLLPGIRRHDLDTVTGHLGVPVASRHRALGDADATAQVLLDLLERARTAGVDRLSDLPGLARPSSGGEPSPRG